MSLLRVSIKGTMPGGEVFSVNPVYGIGVFEPTADQATALALAIDAVTVPTAIRQMIPSSVAYTGVRVEARQPDGTLISVGEHTKASSSPGTASAAHPFQTAMVSSLRTTNAGARGRGRLYWPAQGVVLGTSTMRVSSTDVGIYLTAVAAYLAAIETAIETVTSSAFLGVWSRSNNGVAQVTKISMGDICDVQRRRRDSVVENYTTATYTGP